MNSKNYTINVFMHNQKKYKKNPSFESLESPGANMKLFFL